MANALVQRCARSALASLSARLRQQPHGVSHSPCGAAAVWSMPDAERGMHPMGPWLHAARAVRPVSSSSSSHEAAGATSATATTAGAAAAAAPKAAFMVIGDEILSGSIADTNTHYLAKLLHSRGVDLVRVEFIPDSREDISATLMGLRRRVGPGGFVFTSGGIGPTHDDVTYEAIAAAMGAKLELHAPTVARMREHYDARGMELNEARLRMATLPAPCEVLFTPGLWVPLVNLDGVYILPGIPRLFQAMVSAHQERFTGVACSTEALYTLLGEGDLATRLTQLAAAHPKVSIGSYPHTGFDPSGSAAASALPYRVKLAFSSRDSAALAAAVAAVREALGDVWLPPPSST